MVSPDKEITFQEGAFLLIDRLERVLAELKEQLRTADDFLLMAQAQMTNVMQQNGPGIPHLVFDNQMPQSVGLQAGWQEGRYVVMVCHRGMEGVAMIPPNTQAELEI